MQSGMEHRSSMVLLAKDLRFQEATQDSLAERSKAVAQGAIPKGCGFEPHSCHSI